MENPCLLFQFVTSRLGQTLQHKHFLKTTIPPRRLYSEVFYRANLSRFFPQKMTCPIAFPGNCRVLVHNDCFETNGASITSVQEVKLS